MPEVRPWSLGLWHAFTRTLRLAVGPAEHLAAQRAWLTAICELDEHFPGQHHGDDYSMLREVDYAGYVDVPWRQAGIEVEVYARDMIELLVWRPELGSQVTTPFFERIERRHGALLESIFKEALAEIRTLGAEEHMPLLGHAWAAFVASHERFDDFARLARTQGALSVYDLMFLAETAEEVPMESGRDQIVLDLCAAASQVPALRKLAFKLCGEILGHDPPPCSVNIQGF